MVLATGQFKQIVKQGTLRLQKSAILCDTTYNMTHDHLTIETDGHALAHSQTHTQRHTQTHTDTDTDTHTHTHTHTHTTLS